MLLMHIVSAFISRKCDRGGRYLEGSDFEEMVVEREGNLKAQGKTVRKSERNWAGGRE